MTSKLKQFFFACFLLIFGNLYAEYPIYILLTHPRATGTAFEKVIRTHDNITVLHAPYLDPYLIKKYGPHHTFTHSLPDASVTFEDITNKLFQIAKDSPVFFKESGYVLIEYLKDHPDFYNHPQVKIAFLIRDPAKSILSFYKKMATVNESIIGHRQLWELFLLLKDQQLELPTIIDSDEFLKNPLASLNHLGDYWKLSFNENNLCWENGYAEDWRLKDWYVEVASSTQLGSYRGDVQRNWDGIPEYAEVTDEKERLRLQDLYKIQNVYYQNLLKHSFKLTE